MKISTYSSILLLLLLSVFSIDAQDLSGVRIFVNPGHGGYDSNDRNMVIPPFSQGDPNGFWESQSNLDKGLILRDLLLNTHADVAMSRTKNRTKDDLPLSTIVRMANEFNADFMLSIHSNAGRGVSNHVLMLYAGVDEGDTHTYPTATPFSNESRAISTEIAKNLYRNEITTWSGGYAVRGDKTFARTVMKWPNGYGVLRGLTVPGVISEGSMHDYIPETYRLMNIDYKRMEAWHFLKSFATYFKSAEIPTGVIAGSVKDKFLKNEASYYKHPNSPDEFLSINGATVTLKPGNIEYKTDNLHNGVFLFDSLASGTYTVIAKHPDYHADTTRIVVETNKVNYLNFELNKIRNTPPKVIEYAPNTPLNKPVLAASTVWMRFNWDIDPVSTAAAFTISPSVEGKIVFKESNYIMEFVPNRPFEKSTVYTVTLAKSAAHPDGLNMEDDFSFQFFTSDRNELKMLAGYPLMNETHIHFEHPTFTFVFDKKLQTAELINGIQVYDKNGRQLVKNMRSLRHNNLHPVYGSTQFTVGEDLIPNEPYLVKLAKGIKDIDGLYLTDTLTIPFTASNNRTTDHQPIEDFETADIFSVSEEESNFLVSASASRSSSASLYNKYGYSLKYSFSEDAAGEVIYRWNNPSISVNNDSVVGLYIHGDLSGNELYLLFNSESEQATIRLDSLHYNGWKFKEVELTELTQNIDYHLVGFKIAQTTAPLSKSGTLFIDDLLVYGSSINTITENSEYNNVKVYPNPAKEYIYIDVPSNKIAKKISIVNLNGQIIKETAGNRLDASDIEKGFYLLEISLSNKTISKKVIIE